MKSIRVRSFDKLPGLKGVSAACMEQHLRLYAGYVERFNELAASLERLQAAAGARAGADAASVKVDLTFALGAVKNHELYFEMLESAGPPEPSGSLAEAIRESFHSFPQYLADLKQTAATGAGWAWTAYDLDQRHLFNYTGARNGMPVWNAIPILAVDLYGHAYFYDFGDNKTGYIDAIVQCLNWERIGERFAAAVSRSF